MEDDRFIATSRDLDTTLSSAYQAEILGAASGAEMADIEQMVKIVPLITREISIMFRVDVTDLDLAVQIKSVKQRIKSTSVGP